MYKIKIVIKTVVIVLILMFIFSGCPELKEDDPEELSKNEIEKIYDGELGATEWLGLLSEIDHDGKNVNLDLSKAKFRTGNVGGGLVIESVKDASYEASYIAFDPVYTTDFGKKWIVSIILPEDAEMIYQPDLSSLTFIGTTEAPILYTSEDEKIKLLEEGRKKSAFRYFDNLRSVKGKNIKLIGYFAFIDRKSLTELDFPSVGHSVSNGELTDFDNKMSSGYRVDVGHFSFMGCTNLEKVMFTQAAVIGRHAFTDCAKLKELIFPLVWRIEDRAFEGCASLTEVRFETAHKIGSYSFSECVKLTDVSLAASPRRLFTPLADYPLRDDDSYPYNIVYDSLIIYSYAFSGCKALKNLDIKNAWNVHFREGVFENTVSTLYLNLSDGDTADTNYGHPQSAMFLGGKDDDGDYGKVTVENVRITLPAGPGKVNKKQVNDDDVNIAYFINDKYPEVGVSVIRPTP